ncbi:uncharacterized protein N7511_010307 [Penicillium nucicola]|uniref:uncharacterized protein n=1 Tax=Penicillium nucicola TaxID=1850975 RepID=UPI002545694B|nr:uncharacterized protein N7511_010307 [Penicillium nucicola]KAJ5748611.1 hypothetical protein N7511_010307 [Penicillium nucicola]
MSLFLQHIDACLPVTALKAFGWADKRFVFEGQGPHFRVVDDATGVVSAQIQPFKRNNVHGFITLNQRPTDHGTGHVQMIVWGGISVRAINLVMGPGTEVSLSASSAEFYAPDWIMSGCASAENGHHGAFMITANNAIIGLEVINSEDSKKETVISIHQLATSVKSILYSAHVIALSPSHILMASGTVFGEIIVWSCFLQGSELRQANAIASIHHFFTGHDGSIFDVRISPQIASLNGGQFGRLLASCSDDRTVRIWDISDCERKTAQDPSAYSTDGYDLRSTGFGPVEEGEQGVGSESCVAQAFGHIARIWGVHFRSIQHDDQTGMGLVSRGEDSTCIMWDLTWKSTSTGATQYQLKQTYSLHPHYGKHIWSLDLCRLGSETIVYTGGADGALKSFAIEENDDRYRGNNNFMVEQPSSLQKRPHKSQGLKASAFVSHDCLLGSSAQGQVQLGYLKGTETNITWKELCIQPELASWVLMTSEPRKGLALISNARGLIRLYNHSTKSIVEITELGTRPLNMFFLETQSAETETSDPSKGFTFLVCYTAEEKVTLVTVSDMESDCPSVELSTIGVPPSFVAASAALIFSGQYLAVGSKGGGLAIFETFDTDIGSRPVLLDRRVHGKEFVNHLSLVSSVTQEHGSSVEYLLSCGRDGTYCVHKLELCKDREEAVSMQIVHRTASLVGGNIEGGYFDKMTGHFMLYGFRSQDFVLRNESKLTDVVSIASGGFRRAWAFHPGTKDSDALFTWRDQGALQTTRIRHDARCLLRAGAHGRELKSVDVFNPIGGGQSLIATGAEDTTVRLFKSAPSMTATSKTAFECLRVLDTHRSGIQQVTWSKDGRFLFTSAAYEEFFVWKISEVPSFGIATKLIAASPKDDADSDLRVPSFDILEVEDHDGEQSFIVCLALANSTLKIFHFSPSNEGQFTLLASGRYTTNCLTQAHFLVKNLSVSLITAATDGHFTLWDLTSILEPFYTITNASLKAKKPLDGSSFSPENIACENRYQIHSNSIKSLELVPISETTTLIVAGGDDNSISVSRLMTTPDSSVSAQVATVSIPDAHAAAVTAVKVLSSHVSQDIASNTGFTSITVASSGNDHRIKIWLITLDPTQLGTQGIKVEFLLNRYSSVADVSSLGLIHGSEHDVSAETDDIGLTEKPKLVVGGVGMEMFGVKL